MPPNQSFGRRSAPAAPAPGLGATRPDAGSRIGPSGDVPRGPPPRGSDAVYRADRPPPAAEFSGEARSWSIPWLSLLMLGAMAAVFWIEAGGPGGPIDLAPTVTRMRALGGLSGVTVLGHGEWWRLFTAPLMHANLEHIIGNGVVLILCGVMLEGLIGRAWYAATFVVGGVGGCIASLTMNGPSIVCIGASGAIMALLAATFMCSFHPEAVFHGRRMRWTSLRIAVPALIPFAAAGGSPVDYSGHFGGAAAGLGMGFVMLALWKENEPKPPHRRLGAGIGLTGTLASAVAFALVALNYPAWAATDPRLAPESAFKGTTAEIMRRTPLLVLRYPRDPRVRFFHALALHDQQDDAGMEQDLRAALAEPQLLAENTGPDFGPTLTALLAASVDSQGRHEEARMLAGHVCDYPFADPDARSLVAAMRARAICG